MKTRRKAHSRRKQTRKQVRGGARPSLPINATHTPEMWQFYYCSSHGSLAPTMYKVPQQTYILHVAPAGKACRKVQWFFDNWIYQYEKAPAPGTKSIKQKLLDSLRAKSFLQTANADMRQYLGSLETTNVANLTNLSLNFYEPDDIVSNLNLSMYNHNMPLFLQGLYEIPIPYSLKKKQFNINKTTQFYTNDAEINSLNISNLGDGAEPTEEELDNYHTIYNIPENLLQSEMFTANRQTFTLHEILQKLGPVPPGQFRLLIVDACRVASTDEIATRARRMSIAARRKPLPNTTPRPWFTIEWLRTYRENYINWIKRQRTLTNPQQHQTLQISLRILFDDLNANKTISRYALYSVLKDVHKFTGLAPELATILAFN